MLFLFEIFSKRAGFRAERGSDLEQPTAVGGKLRGITLAVDMGKNHSKTLCRVRLGLYRFERPYNN